jgi:hypothetical protein
MLSRPHNLNVIFDTGDFICCTVLLLALLAVLASSAVPAAGVGYPTRELLQQYSTSNDDQSAETNQLDSVMAAAVAAVRPAAQGIDQACVLQNCLQQGIACLSDADCKAATDVIQACR